MKRRDFLKNLAIGCSGTALATQGIRVHAAPGDYQGRFLVSLQLSGGWDVTSLCDPKMNQPGERIINNWAQTASTQTIGRINYAPFASNARLFTNHYRKMLVINGVDAQTNSHSTGVLHNFSGINTAGQPTLTALFAGANAPELPLAYVNNGGFVATEGLLRYNRLDRQDTLRGLLDPVSYRNSTTRTLRRPSDISRVQAFQQAALRRRLASETLTPMQAENVQAYLDARVNRDSLRDFLNRLPTDDNAQPQLQLPVVNVRSRLLPQIQLALLTFQSGVGAACDLQLRGFDTHSDHDARHTALYDHLADAIDYFWNFAGELGIADRITLVIGSDFGRTPRYNSGNGKDHWPIGSVIVMENNPAWGNRVVGVTDEGHRALKINPQTLARDDANGIILHPKHIHQALRRRLGIDGYAEQERLSLTGVEEVALFAADRWT